MAIEAGHRLMLHPLTLDRLEKALQSAGCPICALMDGSTRRYLRGLLREQRETPVVWERLVATWGLCRQHSRALLAEDFESAPGQATAMLYRWLAGTLLRRAGWKDGTGRLAPRAWRRLLKTDGGCVACEQLGEYQRAVVSGLVRTLAAGDTTSLREAYRRGPGLCLGHLRQGLGVATEDETVEFLMHHFLAGMDGLAAELDTFLDTRPEARRPSDPAHAVWLRVVERFAGRLGGLTEPPEAGDGC